MRAIRYSLAFFLLAFFVGCDRVPTDARDTADAALFAKGGNKPPQDPPGDGGADPAIAFGASGTLHVMNADGSMTTALVDGVGHGFSWSPDGKSLAYGPGGLGSHETIVVAELTLSNGVPVVAGLTDLGLPHPGAPSWSPVGDLLAYAGGCDPGEPDGSCPPAGYTNHLRAVPSGGGTAFTIYQAPGCSDPWDCLISGVPTWSPDGSRIAFVEVRDGWTVHALRVVDVADAPTQVSQALIGPGALAYICSPDWSPDGSRIAFWGHETSSDAANLFVFDVAAGTSTNVGLTSPGGNFCEDLSWSPDGTRWVVRQSGAIRIVDADPSSPKYGQVIPRSKSKLAWGYSPDWRRCEAGTGCGLAP